MYRELSVERIRIIKLDFQMGDAWTIAGWRAFFTECFILSSPKPLLECKKVRVADSHVMLVSFVWNTCIIYLLCINSCSILDMSRHML